MTLPALDASRRWLRDGTAFLLLRTEVADLAAASPLPGWRNGHVLAHLSRNADALARLASWARTGIETPMYASASARIEEIDRDAERADDIQRADVRTSAERLSNELDELEDTAWYAQVRTVRGRLIPAREIPWMRVKEAWLHAVDLGAPIADVPLDVVAALLDDVADTFAAKPDSPDLRLVCGDREWIMGQGGLPVSGSPAALLGWLTGRADGAELSCARALPALPAWL